MDQLLSPAVLCALLFGYLLGSIPFGLILTRASGSSWSQSERQRALRSLLS